VMITAASGMYPADNSFPVHDSDVGFVNYPNDVRLAPSSAFFGTATDGTNPGAADSLLIG